MTFGFRFLTCNTSFASSYYCLKYKYFILRLEISVVLDYSYIYLVSHEYKLGCLKILVTLCLKKQVSALSLPPQSTHCSQLHENFRCLQFYYENPLIHKNSI